MAFFVFGQLACLSERLIVILFLIHFFGWKNEMTHRKIAVAGMCMILLLTAQMNGIFRGSEVLVFIVDIILLMLFSRIFLKGSFRIQMMGCITPFLIIPICNILIIQIMSLLQWMDVQEHMKSEGYGFVIGVILSKTFLGLILYWLQKKFGHKNIFLSTSYYRIINGVCVYMIILELMLYYAVDMGVYQRKANVLLELIAVGMAVTAAYIGYSVYVISRKNEALAKMELLHVQYQEKERQLREIKRAGFRENQLLHDYKNHCMCMQKLMEQGNFQEAERYLSEILGSHVWDRREYVQTDHDTLNALVNTKIAYCEERQIPIHCVITGNVALIDGIQYMVILFNLLDNAIEASERLEAKRCNIEVELYCRDNAMELFVKNNISYSVLMENPEMLSDKGQKGHGIGHKSVEASVEELDGMLEYYEEDGKFCVHVFVPFE